MKDQKNLKIIIIALGIGLIISISILIHFGKTINNLDLSIQKQKEISLGYAVQNDSLKKVIENIGKFSQIQIQALTQIQSNEKFKTQNLLNQLDSLDSVNPDFDQNLLTVRKYLESRITKKK